MNLCHLYMKKQITLMMSTPPQKTSILTFSYIRGTLEREKKKKHSYEHIVGGAHLVLLPNIYINKNFFAYNFFSYFS